MLQRLTIANFILVEKVQMPFSNGLSVLTGETGAGKSILLGALGLLLGERASGQPLFDATQPATLTAEAELTPAIEAILRESGLEIEEDSLIIRRQLLPDGKSRASVNDQPVAIALLKTLGKHLVEIHGQQGQSALTDRAHQRQMLDQAGGHAPILAKLSEAYAHWQQLVAAKAAKLAAIKRAAEQEDYLRHIYAELSKLAPKAGEEEELAVERRRLMLAEKTGQMLQDAKSELEGVNPVDMSLARASRLLVRSDTNDDAAETPNPTFDTLLQSLDNAQNELAVAFSALESLILESGYDPKELDSIESRLFELRGAARKHKRPVETLPEYLAEITQTLATLDSDESALAQIEREEVQARQAYEVIAQQLHEKREKAGKALAKKVMAELASLKMESTQFRIALNPQPQESWSAHGFDAVGFEVSTNAGAPFGSLAKIASGGELSRFMLALKVVLAEGDSRKTLIFDEIDTGTSGKVAEAIGERLARLSESSQVIVITHLPQVASKGITHFKVAKTTQNGQTRTQVEALNDPARREELAQMLSGHTITEEARKVADKMLKAVS